jgi:SAM-dependent methyltransferase
MRAATKGRSSGFDRDYYQRYYYDGRTAVASRSEMRARARLIAAFVAHAGLPVRRILDAGCGTGSLRRQLLRLLPDAHYVALDSSEYLCRRYGWLRARIEEYRVRVPFDLVICYDVLQYLPAATAQRALANLGRLCRGVLYFTALTRHDYEHNCDQARTDAGVYLRSAHWYRARLRRQFSEAGLGFWLRRRAPITLWELESK